MDLLRFKKQGIGGTLIQNIVAHSLEKLYTEFEKADRIFLESGLKDMDAHERLSTTAEAAVLVEAAKSSYGRAAKALGEDAEITKTADVRMR